ncbi:NYN domain-containing protein [Corynebacterium senegalense]|uniref:NYN domain-containing protein n=1 Tax=Corynebacterium senegalense TaxID=2080750 RepID=UPI000E1FC299|nr:NYN domain-containing protein [Corynebacterium senegalense]
MLPSNMPAKISAGEKDLQSDRSESPNRVAVFIDYENARQNAREAFLPFSSPSHVGVFDPVALATHIVSLRNFPSKLAKVYVFRGRPNPKHQPEAASAFDKYAAKWKQSEVCELRSRDLKYRHYDDGTFSAQEKGIDVDLAVQAIQHAVTNKYDVIIIMSNDSDLLPAVEFIYHETRPRLEVAGWEADGQYPLRIHRGTSKSRAPYCHYLGDHVFRQVQDD